MDSVSQIALGSALTIATLGRRTAVWKAAFWGLVAGTLPDLDVFIDHGSALANMINHRGNSHSLLYLLLLSPLLGWGIARLQGEGAHWRRWWLAMALVLVTHPILDWFTIYGTQLLRPFSTEAYGLGSVFVIDPLYTLPLLIGIGVALCRRSFAGLRANRIGLALSCLYLGWSVLAQQYVGGVARESLAAQRIAAPQLLVTPAPLNTLLWRVVAMDDTHYWEGFHSLFDPDRTMAWTRHERGTALQAQYAPQAPAVQQLARFADGFVKLERQGDALYLSDLRMGSEGRYSFRFLLGSPAEVAAGQSRAEQQPLQLPVGEALRELWQRIWHRP
ncbi:metal-dependent hydrolase [Comamonas endophytica]|uniref:Metal-dependent hydrolase n=1 Tax=Comamonas endophytica TaxID=2949090 RepID=A0ABY6G892_9BURK|nr:MULTISPECIES: metal-dependent hydrolase [unclassified Acidovorax]MCD2511192.1 metal-dependent hydrolase [Acidovorax sp. D4N7]UYG50590.1 metal-dependent hydrolase [Acidovorax sp. 5MLIR]